MAFVPEGQADSSQVRSAWVAMQRGPVPEGRGYFPRDCRHFVPGYYRAVPPGRKPSARPSASHYPSAYSRRGGSRTLIFLTRWIGQPFGSIDRGFLGSPSTN
jgi:hypothetical protein